jgi:hypothetical protein
MMVIGLVAAVALLTAATGAGAFAAPRPHTVQQSGFEVFPP